MYFNRNPKKLIFSVFGLLFVATLAFFYVFEQNYSMGVKIISEEKADQYSTFVYTDYSDYILYNDYPVAIDKHTRTIYLTQAEEFCFQKNFYALSGRLELTLDNHDIYFVKDENFRNLGNAVSNGETFRLIIAQKDSSFYMDYNVAITSLPIMTLEGRYAYTDKLQRALFFGDVTVYSPKNPDTQQYSVVKSITYWRNRGDRLPLKKSYKLSLKDANIINFDEEFLGLGKDDDWLLNSMKIDDTFVKERLVMQLWNNLAQKTNYNRKMSYGEFCELIINGEYKGLYMLQRRVDEKYLELSDTNILAKGGDIYIDVPIHKDVELVYSPFEDDDYTYSLLNTFYTLEDCSQINVDNFIDINIFLQFGMLADNFSYKNIVYIMDYLEENTYEISLLLWDTDVSFFVNSASDLEALYFRRETEAVKEIYPDLDTLTAQRWFELRTDILSNTNIENTIASIYREFSNSGAIQRDYELWGLYQENDSVDKLFSTVNARLEFLDNYYSQFL